AHLKLDNTMYSRFSTHDSNLLILFYPKGDYKCSPIPGTIKFIYGCDRAFVFAVLGYSLLPHATESDPFAAYPHFPTKSYSSALSNHLETVELSWVVRHFSRWVVTDDCIVILSLCWVSN
ncbi:hypothetical protein F5J12DRAFT_704378, partial [Pisolithus orientalis]|uniref:uncharacterized protein n=1 Tax=Pisolithus orientalis TaxID=936130 RepID=UPI00222575C1